MSVKLIYHQPEEPQGTPSPIEEAIDTMVRGQHVDIACPYLSLPYLEQIIKQASSWRLLSDVDQWIGSQKTKDSQRNICNFIKKKKNSRRVRDYRKLHAKVIIAKENALVGSANFTNSGLGKRDEMCMLLERTSEVVELHVWFDRLWELSDPANRNGLSLLIRDRPNQTIPDSPYRLSSTAPRISSKLAFSTKKRSAPVAKNNRKADDRRVEPAVDVDYPNSISEESMETDKQKRSAAVKAAIDAVKSVDSSEYVEGIRVAAEIIGEGRRKGFSHEQVRNLVKKGELDNYRDGGRYGRFKFRRSDLERLANPENRKKPGRKIGWKKKV